MNDTSKIQDRLCEQSEPQPEPFVGRARWFSFELYYENSFIVLKAILALRV